MKTPGVVPARPLSGLHWIGMVPPELVAVARPRVVTAKVGLTQPGLPTHLLRAADLGETAGPAPHDAGGRVHAATGIGIRSTARSATRVVLGDAPRSAHGVLPCGHYLTGPVVRLVYVPEASRGAGHRPFHLLRPLTAHLVRHRLQPVAWHGFHHVAFLARLLVRHLRFHWRVFTSPSRRVNARTVTRSSRCICTGRGRYLTRWTSTCLACSRATRHTGCDTHCLVQRHYSCSRRRRHMLSFTCRGVGHARCLGTAAVTGTSL